MSRAVRVGPCAALLTSALIVGSCLYARDPYYCEGQPNNYCPDGAVLCRRDADCPGAAPVCYPAGASRGVCVQCTPTAASACAGPTPVCGAELACRACRAHSECASAACLPDGSCAAEETVAYLAPTGDDSAACTQARPCRSFALGLATGRPVLKLAGTVAESVLIEGGRRVTVLAEPGAALTGAGTGANLLIRGAGTRVAIHGLTIAQAPNTELGYGVFVPPGAGTPYVELTGVELRRNPAGAISVSVGTLALTRSTLVDNLGGGLYVAGVATTFVITDNVIAYNGRARAPGTSALGGATLLANTEGSRFERNTVAFNESDGTYAGGVHCSGPLVGATGNLLYHNGEADGLGGVKVTGATQLAPANGCATGTSLAVPTDARHLGFRSPITPPYDFHLSAETPASVIDAGGACSGRDLDGDPRPLGAACDLGADERSP